MEIDIARINAVVAMRQDLIKKGIADADDLILPEPEATPTPQTLKEAEEVAQELQAFFASPAWASYRELLKLRGSLNFTIKSGLYFYISEDGFSFEPNPLKLPVLINAQTVLTLTQVAYYPTPRAFLNMIYHCLENEVKMLDQDNLSLQAHHDEK